MFLFQGVVGQRYFSARAVVPAELVLGDDFGVLIKSRLTVHDGQMIDSTIWVFLHNAQELLARGGEAAIIAAAARRGMHYIVGHNFRLIHCLPEIGLEPEARDVRATSESCGIRANQSAGYEIACAYPYGVYVTQFSVKKSLYRNGIGRT